LKGERMIGQIPRAMRTKEVEDLVSKFADGAVRLKSAGFDIIMILAGHGYLFNQFLSPYHNRRTDKYGGSEENRMRFLMETVQAVREKIGDTPLMVRLSASEDFVGGYEFDYIERVSLKLQELGVDSINYSNGNYHGFYNTISSHHGKPCHLVPYAERSSKILDIPVSCVGRITTPDEALDIIVNKKADMVWMGRQFLADPNWLKKVKSGGRIRYCLACNQGCIGRFFEGKPIACSINYEVGRQIDLKEKKKIKPEPKRVLVIGGGVSGMETARVASNRGHMVTLIEKTSELGGQLIAAGMTPSKERCTELKDFLEGSIRDNGVNILLNTPYSNEILEKVQPDEIIIATGAVPVLPKIKGIANNDNVVLAEDFLRTRKTDYMHPVIIGGGQIGIETAELLLKAGCQDVKVFEICDDVLQGVMPLTKAQVLLSVQSMSCEIHVVTKILEVGNDTVTYECIDAERFDGPTTIPADIIIIATGYKANPLEIEANVPVHCIASVDRGDILHSIEAAGDVAWNL
ncbi:FAD-dependent oxidoreductase, partial [Alkalibaculum bacchi]|uniref:oxidoreductase n=1 Tax=Alkalibaculum bacchi TaxID=645887 RepID=UPI0026F266D8